MLAATKFSNWWLDSGATMHVCNDKTLFPSYAEQNDGKFVLMGNHQLLRILENEILNFNLHLERNCT